MFFFLVTYYFLSCCCWTTFGFETLVCCWCWGISAEFLFKTLNIFAATLFELLKAVV